MAEAAVRHAIVPVCCTLAVGTLLSSARARQVKLPPTLFIALSAGCGVFRFVNHFRGNGNSKLAAWLASMAFFRLCADPHRHIVLAYGCVEVVGEYYAKRPFLSYLGEQTVVLASVIRLIYTFMTNPEWLPPSSRKLLDYQANIPISQMEIFRQNFHSGATTRCVAIHPNETCGSFAISRSVGLVERGVQIFVPLHTLSLVATMVARKTVHLDKAMDNLVRSIGFLFFAYSGPFFCSCMLPQKDHKVCLFIASATTYPALFVEPSKRRQSLQKAIMCWSLVSLVLQVKTWKLGQRLKGFPWSWLGAAAYAAFMVKILAHPESHNQWVMRYLYGRDMKQEKEDEEPRQSKMLTGAV
ncbi:hypothetical protein AeRB84_007548 [Aphanomyces euteiches]|nr:hypothetical protein AeRB84_007548 [Aphanomyces euteiches]